MRQTLAGRATRSWFLFAPCLLLAACDAGYYLHLAAGQADLILNCESTEDLLADPTLDPELEKRLLFVRNVLIYARDELHLGGIGNYQCFHDTEGEPVSWNVSACPPDRFEPYQWRFPIVGSVPYKGFFDRNRADVERRRLAERGYDAMTRPVFAYSTLGFFSDPLLSTMVSYPDDSLAELLLHELTHATVYAKSHTEFNESLATFVGKTGSLRFLEERHGPASQAVRNAVKRRQEAAHFRQFMRGVVDALDSLYSLGLDREVVLERRVEVFERSKERYRSLDLTPGRYDGFLKWEINNARLLSYRRYNRNLDIFAQIQEQRGGSLATTVAVAASCEGAEDPWQCIADSAAAGDARTADSAR